jgi:tetratricopeptide (TPR) repeat protein
MNQIHTRIGLYGGAVLALAALGLAVADGGTEADAMTLLGSADVQLRLAYGMPERDPQGAPLTSRAKMIDEAIVLLAAVERQQPGMAVTAEFRGFAHMLQGEFAAAAGCYARARDCRDCDGEQFDVLAFNEARMRRKAGDGPGALAVFTRFAGQLDARFGAQRRLEEAGILRELGRGADAKARLAGVLADAEVEPMAWLQAGLEYEQLAAPAAAAAAFARAAPTTPIADYHLARLKLRAGDADSAFDCLQRAATARPAEVRRMLADEPEVWQPVAADARFQQIEQPVAATPGR